MDYLFEKYPKHLSLDVSTDNVKAVNFYKRVGLDVTNTYLSEDKVEFNKFETPAGFIHVKRVYTIKEEVKRCAEEETSSGKRSDSDDTDTLVSDTDMNTVEQHGATAIIEIVKEMMLDQLI